MSTIPFAVTAADSHGAGILQTILRLLASLARPRLPAAIRDLPVDDRRPLRETDHDRLVRAWDNSPWHEIRNQHGVWR